MGRDDEIEEDYGGNLSYANEEVFDKYFGWGTIKQTPPYVLIFSLILIILIFTGLVFWTFYSIGGAAMERGSGELYSDNVTKGDILENIIGSSCQSEDLSSRVRCGVSKALNYNSPSNCRTLEESPFVFYSKLGELNVGSQEYCYLEFAKRNSKYCEEINEEEIRFACLATYEL